MSTLYLAAGINHFVQPKFYLRIIPPIFKNKERINQLSGAAEIILAIGLITPLQSYAAWGIILLLITVFPANIYHLQQKGAGMKVPIWVLWLRLPLQLVLIWWAYLYT
ncbi:DoxX family protein [Reichenbachiella agarivorans]|uniref:DoxX family protein n=1 Tax=Reichenbachiella agarivorans TaxID=2979464 RepID=A0ABY6CP85_9BACT|nr:DoxX family protein [Reichenbachiella agarivorans]UXP31168.1 DoxX family protein [Reichenbachiella agarivorans]